jgi:hypothetical protein
MMNHALVAGTLPEDAAKIEACLDAASKEGFVVHSTSTVPIPATPGNYKVYYTATLVRAVPDERPTGISMRGGPRG